MIRIFWAAAERADRVLTQNFVGATSFTVLSPALGQIFFIGDGLTGTGSGSAQTFIAPAGAQALYLGVPDTTNLNGPPGYCDDNAGAFNVTVTATGVPEPAGFSIVAVAAVAGLRRARRSRSST